MSGGEQQILALGRAMMSGPRLLLLDEPSMGLAPLIVDSIFAVLSDIRAAGTTILLVEQNASAALDIADSAYVLENGTITLNGTATEVGENPKVISAYLGG
jgi:branched-chain amino acid transport system ATP-binding protein